MGQWGRATMETGTMASGPTDTRTSGPWDNENGPMGHWRITYWDNGTPGKSLGCCPLFSILTMAALPGDVVPKAKEREYGQTCTHLGR